MRYFEFDPTVLPRFDLREEAFKKYELVISEACKTNELCIDPKTIFARSLKPHSFITRFHDAILGYLRYGYSSEYLDPSFNYSALKAFETPDGQVLIRNSEFGHSSFSRLSADNPEKLVATLLNLRATKGEIPMQTPVHFSSPEQLEWLKANLPILVPKCFVQARHLKINDGYILLYDHM
jgi:hypothetical protein